MQPHTAEGDAAGGEASGGGGLRGSTLQPISEQQTPSTPSSAPMGSLTSPAMYSSTASGSASSREDALTPLPARGARHSLTGAIGGSASASGAGVSGKRRTPTELHLHSTRGASAASTSRGSVGGGGGGANSSSSRVESTSTSTSAATAGHAAVGRAASATSYELDEADEEAFEEAERERERERGDEEELDLSTLFVGEETARAALVASQQMKRWWQDVKRARAVQHELHIPNQYMNPLQFQHATDPRWLADAMRAVRSQYRF